MRKLESVLEGEVHNILRYKRITKSRTEGQTEFWLTR